ncbi:hypothetical protein Cgig2_017298 [Carnegiea gigantea]|uniref:Protein FAR1-RELATED SEQUENCE n=1 Tax=Carnegiea gigantea TaxID=171969 RepID=A0A9Q1QIU4_9CARY|nr:hypothetical protein Cgig2_017298 [Carnegiea gigantea]
MMEKYDCSNNRWLSNLYTLREKWCPAFSKFFFPSGVLSSQRNEITNRSLKRRLRATTDLRDFYNIFCDVVSEWRSKENGEDHRCSKGNVEMAFPSVNILKHAMSVYTIKTFLMFEKEFIDGAAYNYKAIESSSCAMSFEVWGIRVGRDSHGCKGIKDSQTLDLGTSNGKENVSCSLVWRMQMIKKINSIITASQMNKNARAHCEQYCMELKKVTEFDVGSIHIDEDGQGKDSNLLPNVLNPPGFHQKGVRNKRLKSTVEKKCDQLKWRKSKKLLKTDVGLSSAQSQILLLTLNLSSSVSHVQHHVGSFAFAARMDSSPSSMVAGFRTDAILMLFKVQIFASDYVICCVGGGRRSAEVVVG